jgi:hypothetical protein
VAARGYAVYQVAISVGTTVPIVIQKPGSTPLNPAAGCPVPWKVTRKPVVGVSDDDHEKLLPGSASIIASTPFAPVDVLKTQLPSSA